MPFDDKPKDKIVRKGMKLNNANSTISVPENHKVAFEQQADEVIEKIQDFKQRSADLGAKFKSFILDNTLDQNKSPLVRDLEKEVIYKLTTLATELNNDETQPEGMGGVALASLLMKVILLQRDSINNLSFKTKQLEDKINKIEKNSLPHFENK